MSPPYDTRLTAASDVLAWPRSPSAERPIDATWAALVTLDADCRIHSCNHEAERISGLSAATVVGRHVCDVLCPVSSEQHAACPWQRAVTGTERRVHPREVTLMVGERRIEVLLGARSARLSDGRPGAVLTFVDLTHHHELERLRAALMEEVLHELRSPIGAISMAAHFLSADLEHLPAESVRSMVATIQRSAGALLADLNDLLNRSTFTTDVPSIVPTATDLAGVVEQAVWKLQPLLEQRDQRVRLAYGVVPLLWADERRVEQVVVNVLANANKYAAAGDEIVIAAAAQGNWLRVSVEDHGPGIPPEERARIFERFYRGRASATTVSGAGLGLAIVRRIVEAHGGAVGVEDSSPRGARFWFTLPLAGAGPV